MKIKSLYIIVFLAFVSIFSLYSTKDFAQRYRDRGQQSQNADERKAEDNPDSLANKDFVDRLVYGANVSLAGDLSSIEISPILGYRLTPKLQAGVGATYIYWNYYDPFLSARIVGAVYGGRVYAEYDFFHDLMRPNDKVFGHIEYETLNVPFVTSSGVAGRSNIYDPYVGAGYRSPLGRKAYLNLTLVFNMQYAQYQDLNPYPSPLQVRIGVTF